MLIENGVISKKKEKIIEIVVPIVRPTHVSTCTYTYTCIWILVYNNCKFQQFFIVYIVQKACTMQVLLSIMNST